jgi:Domain of unknown function (DUF4382)
MKKLLFILIISTITFYACQKENVFDLSSSNTTNAVKVYLTDGPLRLDTVNLDIKLVELKLDTNKLHKMDDHFGDNDFDFLNNGKSRDGFGYWDTLTFTPGVYNIAALRNGVDQAIASGNVPGTVRKIRITLGKNNSIVQNGLSYPLVISSNYVYASFNNEHRQKDSLNTAATALKIDIDLFRSITFYNGVYYFNPVLKPFSDIAFASVYGIVTPIDIKPLITIYNNTDTSFGIAERSGFYKVRGIKPGTYNVKFSAPNGYKDTTLTGLVLTAGTPKKLDNITLHK